MSTGGGGINIGGIYADLEVNSGKLDQGLAKGRQALDAIAAEVRKLQADFDRGAVGTAAFNARMAALSQTANELTTRMQAAYASTNTLHTGMEIFNASAGRAGAGAKNLSMTLMQLGYIADDVQYGFMGIVNNVAPLVMSMTGNAGIAAAAQVVAVGVYQLTKNWDEFMDVIGVGVIHTEAEEMDKLAKATERTADEQERLNKYKREEKVIKQIGEAEPKEVAERRALVTKAFGEAGAGAVRGALMADMMGTPTPDEQARIDRAEADARHMASDYGPESLVAREAAKRRDDLLTKVNDRLKKEAGVAADKLMAQATQSDAEGAAARASIEAKRKANPGAFPAKFDENTLANADPGVLRRIDQANAAEESSIEAGAREGAQAAAEEREGYDIDAEEAEASGKRLAEANRKNREEARRKVPGVDAVAERLSLISRASGGAISMDQVVEQISGLLESKGLSKTQAYGAAADISRGAESKIKGDIAQEKLRPAAHAQVFDSTELAAKIQSAVGGDDTKQMVKYLANQDKSLDRIAKWVDSQTGIKLTVKH
jgi:hypothetical protein